MRIYKEEKKANNSVENFTVICNKCKKEIKVESNIIKEGVFSAEHVFGYFSDKDGESHSFDLCEECYDQIIREFAIPPKVTEVNELL